MNINTAIVTINRAGYIQSVDKGCCRMFGYEVLELQSQKINILIPTPYKEQHDSYLENYHRTGKPRIIGRSRVVEGLHKDGTIFPIRLSVSEVNKGTDQTLYIGMIEKLEDKAGVITANYDGKILSCNNNCEALWGYTVNEMVGRNLSILMPEPYSSLHDQFLRNYLRTGKTNVIGKVRNLPGRHKNGLVFPVCLQINRMKMGVVEFFRARVERVEEETIAVFTLNDSGIILSCNRNFVLPLFGYKSAELRGQHIKILMPALANWAESRPAANFASSNASMRSPPTDSSGSSASSSHTNVVLDSSDDNGASMLDRLPDDAPSHAAAEDEKIVAPQLGKRKYELYSSSEEDAGSNESQKLMALSSGEGEPPRPARPSPPIPRPGSAPAVAATTTSALSGSSSGSGSDSSQSPTSSIDVMNVSTSISSANPPDSNAVRFFDCLHKDGSLFRVALTLSRFMTPNNEVMYSGTVCRIVKTEDEAARSDEPNGETDPEDRDEEIPAADGSGSTIRIVGDYIVKDSSIGQGSYGKVKVGIHRATQTTVAVKILQKDLMDAAELARAQREIEIMKTLNHPHICKLYDHVETPGRLYIMMELASGGELFKYILAKGRVREPRARKFFQQIVEAVDYCHQKNIIHRDIKHKNILLDKDLNVKLIDFGLSNFTIEGGLRSTFCGTPAYSAPEMILAQKYVGPEVDIWSMGVVLYSMLTGEFPFKTVSDIITGTFTDPDYISKDCIQLIRGMLTVDPTTRMTLEAIKQHPWFLRNEPIDVADETPISNADTGLKPRDGLDMLGRRALESSSSLELHQAAASLGSGTASGSGGTVKQVVCEVIADEAPIAATTTSTTATAAATSL